MIKIVAYHAQYYTALSSYTLDEQQSNFSLVPKQILNNPELIRNSERFQYCILYDEEAAGFFSLDFSQDRLIYTQNTAAVLLRSLSINPKFQGKGIAKAALLQLPEFIKQNFPQTNEIVFGVNNNNFNAYQLYLKTGYTDSGNTYDGIRGPQRQMFKKIE